MKYVSKIDLVCILCREPLLARKAPISSGDHIAAVMHLLWSRYSHYSKLSANLKFLIGLKYCYHKCRYCMPGEGSR